MAIAISEYTGHGDVATCIYALKRHGDDMLAATDWMLRLGLGHRGSSSSSSSPPSSFSSSSKLSNAAGTQRIPDAVPPRTPDPTADASRSLGARRDAGVARYAADALVDARFNLQQSEIEVLRRDLRARSEELERASQFLVRQRAQISELQRDSIAREAQLLIRESFNEAPLMIEDPAAVTATAELRSELDTVREQLSSSERIARASAEGEAVAAVAARELRSELARLKDELATAKEAEARALIAATQSQSQSQSQAHSGGGQWGSCGAADAPTFATMQRDAAAAVTAAAARRRAASQAAAAERAVATAARAEKQRANALAAQRDATAQRQHAVEFLSKYRSAEAARALAVPPPQATPPPSSSPARAPARAPAAARTPSPVDDAPPVPARTPITPISAEFEDVAAVADSEVPAAEAAAAADAAAADAAEADAEADAAADAEAANAADAEAAAVGAEIAAIAVALGAPQPLPTLAAVRERLQTKYGSPEGCSDLIERLGAYANDAGELTVSGLEYGLCASADLPLAAAAAAATATSASRATPLCRWTERLCCAFDADHDGLLSTDELRVGLTALIGSPAKKSRSAGGGGGAREMAEAGSDDAKEAERRDELCRATFHLYDADGSGSISKREFSDQLGRSLRMAQLLYEMNASSDGEPGHAYENEGGADQAQLMADAMSAQAFDAADLDHTGVITYDEFAVWFQKHV